MCYKDYKLNNVRYIVISWNHFHREDLEFNRICFIVFYHFTTFHFIVSQARNEKPHTHFSTIVKRPLISGVCRVYIIHRPNTYYTNILVSVNEVVCFLRTFESSMNWLNRWWINATGRALLSGDCGTLLISCARST